MAEENGTGSNLIWAITTIIIVAIIAGAVYYSGFLGGTKKEKIDINVDVPATNQIRNMQSENISAFNFLIKRRFILKFDLLFRMTVGLGNLMDFRTVLDLLNGFIEDFFHFFQPFQSRAGFEHFIFQIVFQIECRTD